MAKASETAAAPAATTDPTAQVAKPEPSKFQIRENALLGDGKTIQALLVSERATMAKALPKHVSVDRMIKGALTAALNEPKLLLCTQLSFWDSMLRAASLGLDVSGTLGSAYLVPFGRTCTLIIGFRGLIDLARRGGGVSRIAAHVVYAQDEFAILYGTEPKITHKPYFGANRKDEFIGVYAIGWLTGGGYQCDFLTLADVEKARASSAAGKSGPWKTHWSEMARKTAVRRLAKYLPLSVDLATALRLEDDFESTHVRVVDARVLEQTNRTASLAERLEAEDKAAADSKKP